MIQMTSFLQKIRRNLSGTPGGSEAFYGAIVAVRAEGVPTLAEARRDYHRMLETRRGYPVS